MTHQRGQGRLLGTGSMSSACMGRFHDWGAALRLLSREAPFGKLLGLGLGFWPGEKNAQGFQKSRPVQKVSQA